jgi:hypothetical protein
MSKLSPQAVTALRHLINVGSITNVEANAVHRIRSLSRRITEIADAGVDIDKDYRKDVTGQRYVRYSIAQFDMSYAKLVLDENAK